MLPDIHWLNDAHLVCNMIYGAQSFWLLSTSGIKGSWRLALIAADFTVCKETSNKGKLLVGH